MNPIPTSLLADDLATAPTRSVEGCANNNNNNNNNVCVCVSEGWIHTVDI